MLKRIPSLRRWLLTIAVLLASVAMLWARAGGGRSSGGGGRSSGGSHSSGGGFSSGYHGGGSYSGSSGSRIGGDWEWVWVILIMVAIYGLDAWIKRMKESQAGGTAPPRRVLSRDAIGEGLRQLREADPAFDERAFLARMRGGFIKLQEAWCAQDLRAVRPFISDGIHERFSLQFEEQRALGYRGDMENLRITDHELAEVECTPVFDVVTMRIAASARDRRVSLEDGRALSGTYEEPNFVEYWSFIRTRGSQTLLNKAGLIEGHCPNCGAGIEMNQGAKCQYCQALLRSGQYDWVLSEITQEEYWTPVQAPPPGTLSIRDTDPGFNTQTLEDVASVIFWRKATADRLGKIDPLRKVAAPEWSDKYGQRMGKERDQERYCICDCSVSAVTTMGLLPGEPEERALVQILWMGQSFMVDQSGKMEARGEMKVYQSLFVLMRQPGVKSLPEKSLSSAHCPNCGGAVSMDTSNACEFCGTVLNDGSQGWVLRAIWPLRAPEARSLINQAEAASRRGREEFSELRSPGSAGNGGMLLWMIHAVATSAGTMDDSLREMLYVAGKRASASRDQVDAWIRSAAAGEMEVPEPENAREARDWLAEMAVAALVSDGGVSTSETALLQAVGSKFGLAAFDVAQIVARSRKAAIRMAKDTQQAAQRHAAAS